MNIICILGRQPELSLAELEQRFGADTLTPFSTISATVTAEAFDVQTFGGIQKAGRVIAELQKADWSRLSRDIVQRYSRELKGDGKLTLGISVYGTNVDPRDVQRTGLSLKQILKKKGRSVRLVPNDEAVLSTATSHHNKLGLSDNKIELMVVYGHKSVIIAESLGSQNITALAARDQGRPKRDAFVGMLPPKLALLMVNLSGIVPAALPQPSRSTTVSSGTTSQEQPESPEGLTPRVTVPDDTRSRIGDHENRVILDPFCGTGVVLQEAALLGFNVYGTDLAEKMVDYSKANLEWLAVKHDINKVTIEHGDAVEHHWQQPISSVVAETYLGQPFSAPPAPDKLDKVRRVVDHITASFLENIGTQLKSGTLLCLAVPAWRDGQGRFTYLSVVNKLESLGYEWQELKSADVKSLVYYREDQIVARQLLVIKKK